MNETMEIDGEEVTYCAVTMGNPHCVVLCEAASDDLALKQVDFYIDGRKIASLTQSPFTFPWEATPGKHKLTVKAEDRAGNTAEASLEFSVGT